MGHVRSIAIEADLHREAEKAAAAEGETIQEFVSRAIQDRIAQARAEVQAEAAFAARAAAGKPNDVLALLDRAGDAEPRDGDRMAS